MLYNLIRTLLFRLDAEKSHNIALKTMSMFASIGLLKLFFKPVVDSPVRVMGLEFKNRVGLAAGLDKNAKHIDALAQTGFGFIEVGTVTPKAQAGNDKPRLFRLPESNAIINRMGFNNEGVDSLIQSVKRSHYKGVIGINIGKNFSTPVEKAVDDYLICLEAVYAIADYVTINISSPNTPGLRSLQHGEALVDLLTQLKLKQKELNLISHRYVPLVVKIAPDLTEEEIKELADTFIKTEIDAVIATNTTSSREGVEGLRYGSELGGLSGAPVMQSSTAVVKAFCELFDGKIPVIAAGGIMSAEDALEKMKAGAALVQIYSGFIYKGPELIYQCARALSKF